MTFEVPKNPHPDPLPEYMEREISLNTTIVCNGNRQVENAYYN
jgi:hypothetical protein